MQISLKLIRLINHAKITVCIKFQLLVTFSSLFTGSSSLSVFPRSVLYEEEGETRRESVPSPKGQAPPPQTRPLALGQPSQALAPLQASSHPPLSPAPRLPFKSPCPHAWMEIPPTVLCAEPYYGFRSTHSHWMSCLQGMQLTSNSSASSMRILTIWQVSWTLELNSF